jgi:glycosyltransferase involved in cell wall biosynthesis
MAVVVIPDDLYSRRGRFVLRALMERYGPSSVIWISRTQSGDEAKARAETFDKHSPGLVGEWNVIDVKSLRAAVPQVRTALRTTQGPVVGIGFASLALARAAGSALDVWVVRGIPEELTMYRSSFFARADAWSRWRIAWLAGKPALAIAVSAPMARMLAKRTRAQRVVTIPNTVRPSTFEPPAESAPPRRYLTYLGSGAPWQAIDLLELVWREAARLDPSVRFRIITRDDRARDMADRIGERAHVESATNGSAIARWLWEASAGFLLRRPGIVNEASWPVKLGEYVAAGVPVVTTDIDWDPADFVRDTGTGIVVPWNDPPRQIAERVLELVASGISVEQSRAAAGRLDERMWLDRLVAMLP